MNQAAKIALIKGDGIGIDVADATVKTISRALQNVDLPQPEYDQIRAGATYFQQTGSDIEPDGEDRAAKADAIFLGAIGLPSVRHADGTEISPHLRLRDRFGLYAGIRPVKAYPNSPQRLADKRAARLNLVILRESTEGLFYSAAVHNRSLVNNDDEVQDILRITRPTTERLHRFAFKLATKRKAAGLTGKVTCVDKANVFASMAFFRKIFDEVRTDYPQVETDYAYVDAMALQLVRNPWDCGVLVMENMFGDILSDLAGGLVGGMGMAACAEIGDDMGLFQPAHGSAPDIMGQDKANPLAAILSGAMMLDYLAEKLDDNRYSAAALAIEKAVDVGFEQQAIRPIEFGGDMGTQAVTAAVLTNLVS